MPTVHGANARQLKVPGATLYYEIRGRGPVLLMISGGPTDADVFAALSNALADTYTVVTYDTRGNSRSAIDGPEVDQSIELESDDAHRLLAALGSEPAYLFGNSSGALVGLDLVVRYPQQVRTLVAHEPPAAELLPDTAQHRAHAQDVYDTYRRHGIGAAMAKFMAGAGLQAPPNDAVPHSAPSPDMLESIARMGPNMAFFVGHRLRAISGYVPDVTALRSASPRIVVAVGETSQGQLAHRATLALAERLGREPVNFPGDHGGFGSHPAAFAERLDSVLRDG